VCSAPPLSASVAPDGSVVPAQQAGSPGPSESWTADEDCLICVNHYSLSRLPKVLSCQHVFCAVCLKLLLHNEDQAWRISCPICRKDTTVFGGLVSTLPTPEEAFWHLPASPGLGGEATFFPDHLTAALPAHGIFYIRQDDESGGGSNNRVAARRLLFLVLLLVSLVILALPFLYTGLLKWALCIVVGWGAAMALVLCWSPKWQCGCTGVWCSPGPKTAGHVLPPV
uniref:RING-type domain-containing protein n=1 Tax=Varanus komodoensis TaxID=61221 RepID=A0A8D2KXB1_VARKO